MTVYVSNSEVADGLTLVFECFGGITITLLYKTVYYIIKIFHIRISVLHQVSIHRFRYCERLQPLPASLIRLVLIVNRHYQEKKSHRAEWKMLNNNSARYCRPMLVRLVFFSRNRHLLVQRQELKQYILTYKASLDTWTIAPIFKIFVNVHNCVFVTWYLIQVFWNVFPVL